MTYSTNKKVYKEGSPLYSVQPYELAYWKRKWNISTQQLTGAIRAVGSNIKRVEQYLKNKQRK